MYQKLIENILKDVGGRENIASASHCFTRLRLVLKDAGAADKDAVEKLDKVMKVVVANGQFQIVIGNEVANVFKELMQAAPELKGEEGTAPANAEKERICRFPDCHCRRVCAWHCSDGHSGT